uniref:Putative conserved protein n=1 Tax=uncultured crenarchaeote TaxID=29281 RepID=Q2V9D1_9CREN|nr:putative conserved protein [uncultured crenarchaeote]
MDSGLFTTLSTMSRAIKLSDNKVIISDTVGFISKLPAYMVDAFKSTLQDLTFSSLVLLVLDVSHPYEVIRKQLSSSLIVMNHIGIPLGKIVYVLNKVDLVDQDLVKKTIENLDIHNSVHKSAMISAKTGINMESLLKILELKLFDN